MYAWFQVSLLYKGKWHFNILSLQSPFNYGKQSLVIYPLLILHFSEQLINLFINIICDHVFGCIWEGCMAVIGLLSPPKKKQQQTYCFIKIGHSACMMSKRTSEGLKLDLPTMCFRQWELVGFRQSLPKPEKEFQCLSLLWLEWLETSLCDHPDHPMVLNGIHS